MASSSNSLPEPAIIEQVITEFFAKSLHIILESRSPYVSSCNYTPSSSSSGRSRDKGLNLALSNRPAAVKNFDLWRHTNLDPLVVDVVLNRQQLPPEAARPCSGGCIVQNYSSKDRLWASGQDDFVPETKGGEIVERWAVQYESRPISDNSRKPHSGSKKSSGSEIPAIYKKIYKKSMVLLRSLYVTARLLPAYKIFRVLQSSDQPGSFSLSHRISSFAEPFTREEDAEMNKFCFTAVDTMCGRLTLSVSYLRLLEVVSSEPSTPVSTQFIKDYVGSPMTDRLKMFQSLPPTEPLPTYVSFTKHHSWNNDRGATPSVSPPSSPAYSDSRALHFHTHDQSPSTSSISHNALVAHKRSTSLDEHLPIKEEPPPSGDFQIGTVLQKVLSFGKDGDGFFSRRARSLYPLNEFDVAVFAFVVDDEDLTASRNRIESSDANSHESGNSESGVLQLVKRSPNAVVGALVRILNTAPPLHQDLPNSVSEAETRNEKLDNDTSRLGIAASGLFKPRTTSDALEELRSYKELKELLVRRESGDADSATKSAGGCPLEFS